VRQRFTAIIKKHEGMDAKRPATRAARMEKALSLLQAGKRLN